MYTMDGKEKEGVTASFVGSQEGSTELMDLQQRPEYMATQRVVGGGGWQEAGCGDGGQVDELKKLCHSRRSKCHCAGGKCQCDSAVWSRDNMCMYGGGKLSGTKKPNSSKKYKERNE